MKVTAVAKPATHAKPAKAKKKKTTKARSKAGASKKHSNLTTAHQKHAAHEEHLKHLAHEAHEKALGLSLGEGVACCSVEALAASLRLAGAAVSDDDVLELHWRAGGGTDTGVSVLAALEAAQEFGLAGYRLAWFGPGRPTAARVSRPGFQGMTGCSASGRCPRSAARSGQLTSQLILGLELPGPHAVLAEPDHWWSWGKRYDPASFPHARIEQAWAVSWS